ncbi:uncharacterized protein isoform X2 [Danio rerio]|uniref:Uncharacterized protein isoform X2 n=1 Tax=Danio rerio TaxID=7955 RepID=A0AC58IGF9_DANRE
MKMTLIFLHILLFMCSVFGADANKVNSVSVFEGDSATLNPGQDLQGIILVLWRFGDKGNTIAQVDGKDVSYPNYTELFRGRLKLNQTGSLTINNLRRKHSGDYRVQIDHSDGQLEIQFSVHVNEPVRLIDVHKAELKRLSVIEGYPVTLHTDVTKLHGDELIVWRFGDEGKILAKEDKETKKPPFYDTDEKFRLQLNDQTGSLTVNTMKDTDAGLYTVKISSNKQITYKKFTVTVTGSGLSSESVAGIVVVLLLLFGVAAVLGFFIYRRKISELKKHQKHVQQGESVTLESDTKIQRDDEIQWTFGDQYQLIAKMGKMTGETREITYPDERFGDRLYLDEETGSLIIKNITNEHSGDFKVKISSWRRITKLKMFCVKVNVEMKYVQQGESVTLKPDTEIQSDDEIQWMFGDQDILIAIMGKMTGEPREITYPEERFRDRLMLHMNAGSLTIENITIKDTGDFKVKISSWRRITELKMFCVKINEEKVRVMERRTAVLESAAEIQSDDHVEWRFEHMKSPIAEIKDGEIFLSDGHHGIFKDTLDLDKKTGSLTIKNIKLEHAGAYYLKINNSSSGAHEKRFTVAVMAETVTFIQGRTAVLKTSAEIHNHDQIEWRFNYKRFPIAEIKDEQISTSDGPDGIFKDRLELDKKTGSLTIKNISQEHAGFYQLNIMNSRLALRVKTFIVSVDAEKVTIVERRAAVLKNCPEIQTDDQIEWWFNESLIAEIKAGEISTSDGPDGVFKDALELDKKTGSLTIKNIRYEHAGGYCLKIKNSRLADRIRRFIVFYMKMKVTLMEGKKADLKHDSEVQTDDNLEWMFKSLKSKNESLIAEIKTGRQVLIHAGPDEIFKDTLELDKKTGSLTIRNIRPEHSGDYCLKVINSSSEANGQTHDVFVVDEPTKVMEGTSFVLESAAEIQKDEVIEWRFNTDKSPIAEIKDEQISTSDGPDGMFKDTLELDKKTGSLTIRNIRLEHAGFYQLIIKNKCSAFFHSFFNKDISELDEETSEDSKPEDKDKSELDEETSEDSETEDVEKVTFMEGKTAVLKTSTEIQTDDHIKWRFNNNKSPIAENKTGQNFTGPEEIFKDRLELDKMTGFLSIKNISQEHAGIYQLKITNSSSAAYVKTFIVIVKKEKVRVVEGKTAVLQTPAEIQNYDHIEWRFNNNESPIAEIKTGKIPTTAGPEEIFKDSLELDEKTGSLTLKNIRREHAGIYQLKIMNSSSAVSVKTFHVIVIAEIKTGQFFPFHGPEWLMERRFIGRVPEEETAISTTENIRREHDGFYQLQNSSLVGYVKTFHICVNEEKVTFVEGDTAVLESAAEIQNHDQIEWRFNSKNLIAEFKTGQIFPSAGPDRIFRDRLELDEKTGFLTIRNIQREHAGIYQLKIMNSSSAVSVKRLTVIVNEEKVKVMEGRTAVLESAAEIQSDDHVEWRFNYKKSPIAEIQDEQISTFDGHGEMFKDILELDKRTGSLTIMNIRPEHAGFYLLKVTNSSSVPREKRFTVAVIVSKRKQVKNSAIEETPLSHEDTPLLCEDDVIYENERMSSL